MWIWCDGKRQSGADSATRSSQAPKAAGAIITILSILISFGAFAQEPPKPPQMVAVDGGPAASAGFHDFTQLPLTPDGWTDFQAILASPGYADARVIFVSSSNGNDSSAGIYGVDDIQVDSRGMFQSRASVNAFRTIAAAYAQIRSGSPDILLLNRGDEWDEGFTRTGAGRIKSGRDVSHRHIIATYGTGDRPRIFGAMIDGRDSSYSMVAGLHLYENDWRTAGRALDITGDVNHQLYEDMRFDKKSKDKIQGGTDGVFNVAIRRSYYSHYQAHDGFVYVARVDGLLFEGNVYFEPWQKDFPGEERHGRHLYMSPSGAGEDKNALKNVVVRGNIFYRSERDGLDFRGGGLIENNLFLQNDYIHIGGRGGSGGSIQSAKVLDNVFMQGTPNVSGGGHAIMAHNQDGSEISRNIWTDPRGLASATIINLRGTAETYIAKNINIEGNIFYNYKSATDPSRALSISADLLEVENISIRNNDFQYGVGVSTSAFMLHRDWAGSGGDRFKGFSYEGNSYYSSATEDAFIPGDNFVGWVSASGEIGGQWMQLTYTEPNRTIDTYMNSIGLTGGAEEFMALVMGQGRHNWNPEYSAIRVNRYIRAGFGRSKN